MGETQTLFHVVNCPSFSSSSPPYRLTELQASAGMRTLRHCYIHVLVGMTDPHTHTGGDIQIRGIRNGTLMILSPVSVMYIRRNGVQFTESDQISPSGPFYTGCGGPAECE